MKKITFTQSIIFVSVAVVVLLLGSVIWKNNAPSKYDALAQCITDKGGAIKTAYWCSACAKQEAMFGSAWRLINEIECSSPGSYEFDLCPEITGTPVWMFSDGTTLDGVYPLEQLAKSYSCIETLPE